MFGGGRLGGKCPASKLRKAGRAQLMGTRTVQVRIASSSGSTAESWGANAPRRILASENTYWEFPLRLTTATLAAGARAPAPKEDHRSGVRPADLPGTRGFWGCNCRACRPVEPLAPPPFRDSHPSGQKPTLQARGRKLALEPAKPLGACTRRWAPSPEPPRPSRRTYPPKCLTPREAAGLLTELKRPRS